jgi:hypothetical protein
MTSADDKARAVLRAYADNIQPPPVAQIIARAEHTRENPRPPSTARPRSRRRLVLAAASVAAAIAAVAIAADQLPNPDATVATEPTATQATASTGANRMAPGCPPGGPTLAEGLAKSIAAQAGQQLTLPVQIPATEPDRPLLSFTIYLTPPGTQMNELYKVVAQSPVQRLTPDQQRVSPVLQIPTGLAPGTYDIMGLTTWPGPSLCGVKNPADSTQVGGSWGVLASVVVN